MPAIITSHVLTEEVVRYCETHDLLGSLEIALRLADDTFQPIERLEVSVEPDPEVEGEEYVIIDLWIRASVDEALSRKFAYTQKWVQLVPTTVLGRIRLLFYLI